MTDIVKRAQELRKIIESMSAKLSDEEGLKCVELFPAWRSGVHYTLGQKIRYNNVLYKVLSDHDSQSTWTPETAPSLFAKVLVSENGTPKDWEQPGSTNPYMRGDKVLFNGKTYESLIDNNVWSPSAYPAGWKEI